VTSAVPRRFQLDNPYLLAALASLCWSSNHIVGRAAAGHVPPFWISTMRWLLPAVVVWLFARTVILRDWPAIRTHWRAMLLISLTGGTLFTVLQYVSLQYTTALNLSVLNSLVPVFIAVVAAALFADYLIPRQIAGLAVSLAGVLVVISHGDPDVLTSLQFNKGDLLVVVSMMVSAVYSVSLRLRPPMHWLSLLFVMALVSAVTTLPLAVWEAASGYVPRFDLLTVFITLFVGIVPGFLATVAWNRSVEVIGSNRAGPFMHLVPLYSAGLASVFLGERLGVFHVVGLALILTGVWLASRKA